MMISLLRWLGCRFDRDSIEFMTPVDTEQYILDQLDVSRR